MNREQVESVLNVVKASVDKSVVYKCLLKLRTDVVKDREGIVMFREAGGFLPIIRFLHKPHEKILEVALSILANCCTDDICCKEALDNKIVLPLTVILKSIPNIVIQCRACRLLGNLAKYSTSQLLSTSTNCAAIAQALAKIIESTSDVQTRIMGLRSCRFLLVEAQFLKYFLQENGFFQVLRIFAAVMKNDEAQTPQSESNFQLETAALGLKKNQHREKYFEEVARNLEGVRSDIFDQQILKNTMRISNIYALPKERAAIDLVNEILKCLIAISAMRIEYKVWESLTRQGGTLAPIVYFASDANKQRTVALRILSNFSKNPDAFSIISSSHAIVAACELLVASNMTNPLLECETRHCINIICMLSTDACNRSKMRRSGVLPKLIDVLRNSTSQNERVLILYILNNFEYDNMSMELMLFEGLIGLLIRELNNYLTSDDDHHKRKREERLQSKKKRKLSETTTEIMSKFPKTRDTSFLDIESPSSSPRSYQSISSPCSSRCMSPVSRNLYQNEDADDENYSPACSDDEASDDDGDNVNKPEIVNDNGEIMRLLDIATEPIDENISDKEEENETTQDVPPLKLSQLGTTSRSAIDIIENLLLRVTLMINKRFELGKPDILETLIKAIQIFGGNNNFANSLTNILLESQFFAKIIGQGIVHKLYQLTKSEELRNDGFGFLDTLTNVGESNYGKAELARLLHSGDEFSQQRAAIAVAYIIKEQRLLYQFLNDGNALTLLLDMLLRNKTYELSGEAADAITSMSLYSLGISLPKLSKNDETIECNEMDPDTDSTQNKDCNMRFIVSSNANASDSHISLPVTIEFNKNLLCETSEVFNTMLNSDFREGHEGEIKLEQYSEMGLRYFLNLVERQAQNKKYNIPAGHNYHALLEAFEMSRIYIIPAMELSLQRLLVQLLNEANCLCLFEWALKNYHADLTETAINYYLCSQLSAEAKVALFHEAEYSTFSTEWFQLINDAIYDRSRNASMRKYTC